MIQQPENNVGNSHQDLGSNIKMLSEVRMFKHLLNNLRLNRSRNVDYMNDCGYNYNQNNIGNQYGRS